MLFSRYWLFLLLTLFNSISPYCIVYIHIGSTLPLYIFDSLKQTRLFNKTDPIYVVANEKAFEKIDPQYFSFLADLVTMVKIESLPQSKEHIQFLKESTLDKNFREGFWLFASERFLVLDDLAQNYNLENIIHLENDNMVYVNFSELMPIFKKYYSGIGGIFASDERCIPGLIYFSNAKIVRELAQFFCKHAAHIENDMQTIGNFYKERAKENSISMLPVIMPDYISQYGLKTKTGKIPSFPLTYANHIEEFESIFDGAAIGVYLGGYDPRNNNLGPGSIHPHTVFNASFLKFEWIKDSENRNIPYALFNGKRYRINNIHVHSKKLYQFAS